MSFQPDKMATMARKKLEEKVSFTTKFPPQFVKALKVHCLEIGSNANEFIEKAVTDYIRRNKSPGAPDFGPAADSSKPQITLLNSSGYQSERDNCLIVEGKIRNNSEVPLKDLMGVANWYTKDDKFIRADEELIAANPILPGQVSPFKIRGPANSAMKRYKVHFRTLSGAVVSTEYQPK